MTNAQLQKACKQYKKLLSLQDWDTNIKLLRSFEMGDPNWAGSCTPSLLHKSASIRICDPKDCPEGSMTNEDIHNTIIHELLHLHIEPIIQIKDLTDAQVIAIEQAIVGITNGFITLLKEVGHINE